MFKYKILTDKTVNTSLRASDGLVTRILTYLNQKVSFWIFSVQIFSVLVFYDYSLHYIKYHLKYKYHKDTEPLYHSFMYSLVSLLSGIYPLPAMHSLLVTLHVMKYLKGINQRLF